MSSIEGVPDADARLARESLVAAEANALFGRVPLGTIDPKLDLVREATRCVDGTGVDAKSVRATLAGYAAERAALARKLAEARLATIVRGGEVAIAVQSWFARKAAEAGMLPEATIQPVRDVPTLGALDAHAANRAVRGDNVKRRRRDRRIRDDQRADDLLGRREILPLAFLQFLEQHWQRRADDPFPFAERIPELQGKADAEQGASEGYEAEQRVRPGGGPLGAQPLAHEDQEAEARDGKDDGQEQSH
jgi:hypothetical protein